MHFRSLGRTGLKISAVGLGCGNFGGIGSAPAFFGQGETEEAAAAIMDAAWELGINVFDTADAYGGGRSESFIGRWLRAKGPRVRDQLLLASKVFRVMAHPLVTAPIVGPRRPEHLEPVRRALDLRLTPDERDRIAGLLAG